MLALVCDVSLVINVAGSRFEVQFHLLGCMFLEAFFWSLFLQSIAVLWGSGDVTYMVFKVYSLFNDTKSTWVALY
jgi:hypothetical protein